MARYLIQTRFKIGSADRRLSHSIHIYSHSLTQVKNLINNLKGNPRSKPVKLNPAGCRPMFENILHEFGHYVNSNDVTIMPGTWYLYSSTGGKVTFKVWIGRVIQIRAARVSSLTLNTTRFMLLVTTRFIGS